MNKVNVKVAEGYREILIEDKGIQMSLRKLGLLTEFSAKEPGSRE